MSFICRVYQHKLSSSTLVVRRVYTAGAHQRGNASYLFQPPEAGETRDFKVGEARYNRVLILVMKTAVMVVRVGIMPQAGSGGNSAGLGGGGSAGTSAGLRGAVLALQLGREQWWLFSCTWPLKGIGALLCLYM
jgi:hypothetical protein